MKKPQGSMRDGGLLPGQQADQNAPTVERRRKQVEGPHHQVDQHPGARHFHEEASSTPMPTSTTRKTAYSTACTRKLDVYLQATTTMCCFGLRRLPKLTGTGLA